MKKFLFLGLYVSLFLSACFTKKMIQGADYQKNDSTGKSPAIITTAEKAPSENIYDADKYPYQPTRTRKNDILHTRLAVSFDWAKRRVLGKANLTLQPYFYPINTLELDAKSFDIHTVALVTKSGLQGLSYKYDSTLLTITLDRTYKAGEKYEVYIDYTAKPYERQISGGSAVTSDRGLFFINHDNSNSSVPQQIWTQGETSFNSCWFPTFDSPNEKCTQEIYITVDNKYLTVSNGIKVSSKQNTDGTRTDYWKMDKPHSPYLFALAVGEFVETKDTWRGKEVNYYMEKDYAPYAKAIFGNTPEMMEFYSKILDMEYPWDKYAQIVVREFVSGAMENTTCSIFYDRLNQDDRELLDYDNEDVIAHELFHHWFGDYVTCESYANIALNESFASYSEYLWFEHKYGKDKADYHLRQDLDNYLGEATYKKDPIIRYNYNNPDDLFDRHSYQKGACVLHYLRNYVGDSAFFLTLQRYLKAHALGTVEMADLRMEFEKTTGEDMNWFFNQWFFSPGHPELNYSYRKDRGNIILQIAQYQNFNPIPMYRLPLKVHAFDATGKMTAYTIEVNSADSTYLLPFEGELENVILDAEGVLVGTIERERSSSEMINQIRFAKNVRHRLEAATFLAEDVSDDETVNALKAALKDPFFAVRIEAQKALNRYNGTRKRELLREALRLAKNDENSGVRATALAVFTRKSVIAFVKERDLSAQLDTILKYAIKDRSYRVQATALAVTNEWKDSLALVYAEELSKSNNGNLQISAMNVYQKYGNQYAEKVFDITRTLKSPNDKYFAISSSLSPYIRTLDESNKTKGIRLLVEMAEKDKDDWVRNAAAQALKDYGERYEVRNLVKEQAEKETNPQLREMYQEWKRALSN